MAETREFMYYYFYFMFVTTVLCMPIVNTDDTPPLQSTFVRYDGILSRRERSLSLGSFNRLQGNWKYSKKEIQAMFQKYYDCLEKANKRENRITEAITAVLALDGQRIELKCPTCQRPDQHSGNARLFWQRVRNADASTTHIRPDNKGMKIKKDMTLVIKHVDIGDAGQYFCVKDGDAEIIYQVDVLFKEPQRTVSEKNRRALRPAQKLVDHNIEVKTV